MRISRFPMRIVIGFKFIDILPIFIGCIGSIGCIGCIGSIGGRVGALLIGCIGMGWSELTNAVSPTCILLPWIRINRLPVAD